MNEAEQKVVQYLREAHATELALVRTLQAHIGMAPRGPYRSGLEAHLEETRSHAGRIQSRLTELGAARTPAELGKTLVQGAVAQGLALGKGPFDLVRSGAAPERVLKNAKDEAATEALEIGTYDSLEQLATTVGDTTTAELAAEIRADEEAMLEFLREQVRELTDAVARAAIPAGQRRGAATGSGGRRSSTGSGRAATGGRRSSSAGGGRSSSRSSTAGSARSSSRSRSASGGRSGTRASSTGSRSTRSTSSRGGGSTRGRSTSGRSTSGAARSSSGGRSGGRGRSADGAAQAESAASAAGRGLTEGAKSLARQARRIPGATQVEGELRGAIADASDLPIPNYDERNADEIVARLRELSQIELSQVDAYERRHHNRSTVLSRIDSLRGSEPFAGYDTMSAEDVRKRLSDADERQASAVRDYERAHKGRSSVIEAAEREVEKG